MRWLALFLLLAGPAWGQSVLLQPRPAPVADWNFTRMKALPAGSTFTRASSLNDWSCASGHPVLVTFGTNVPALGVCDPKTGQPLGLSLWISSTILNKWARDLTQNSFWFPSASMTAALTATGIDGVANSATKLTAGAGSQTICSAVVGVAQNQRVLSMYIQGVTVTGEIDVSQDCANWTSVEGQINTANYTRVPGGGHYASLPNSVAGIRIVNSGDSINVDYVNVELDMNNAHVAPTPPVLTTSSGSIVRAVDSMTMPLSAISGMTPDRFTVLNSFMMPVWGGGGYTLAGANRSPLEIDDGTTSNGLFFRTQPQVFPPSAFDNDFNWSTQFNGGPSNPGGKSRCSSVAASELNGLIAPRPGAFATVAAGYDVSSGSGISCDHGAGSRAQQEVVAATGGLTPGQLSRLVLSSPTVITALAGYLQRVVIFNGRYQGQALTALVQRYGQKTPQRNAGYYPLDDGSGGFLAWEGGSLMECNKC